MALLLCVGGVWPAVRGAGVQGYVSGRLLTTWCRGANRLDREACLSYLRGVFDTLQVSTMPSGTGARTGPDPMAGICIPPQVAITELRAVVARYARAKPAEQNHQAATMVLGALRESFPCPAQSGGNQPGRFMEVPRRTGDD